MDLYILRHGIAVELGTEGITEDSARALTAEGEAKTRQIAAALKAMKLSFELILSSPFLRAKQTADIVAAKLKATGALKLTDALAVGGSPRTLVRSIANRKPVPQSVLLVGHEPYLSELISLLVAGPTGLDMTLKKGGLAKLAVPRLKYGRCATLEWLLTPKQLALMAG